LGKEVDWKDKNVDLGKLAKEIERFFRDDGFNEVKLDQDPNGTWHQIQARKKGVLRTLGSSRKVIQVIIKGEPNKFTVTQDVGEWGKNVAVAALLTGGIGLIGLGLNVQFTNKLWDFIQNSVINLQNSHTGIIPEKADDPLVILKKRLALGNITKEEYEDLKSTLE